MNLPPLPDKVQVDKHLPTGVVIWGYTKESMRAYGEACAAAALEEAATACDEKGKGVKPGPMATERGHLVLEAMAVGALNCAAAIRAMKVNT